uniref:Uncharacterized protein n=1 Tax=Lotharella globosa TaxID=91324 RepID=A0A7S3Z970_9EUKA|mmetsp:Transcript_2623/g.5199  ORF Transcript_2623/g.5199 Transcript_2623/m.5199 type:complete len:397 (+) Transcript_2623:136-1326(+)
MALLPLKITRGATYLVLLLFVGFASFLERNVLLLSKIYDEHHLKAKIPKPFDSPGYAFLQKHSRPLESSISYESIQCRSASIAVCMLGNGYHVREKANLNEHWIREVVEPLGGVDNLEVFVNANERNTETNAYKELSKIWPNIPHLTTMTHLGEIQDGHNELQRACNASSKRRACAQMSTHVQGTRKLECLRTIKAMEKHCNKRYRWIVRDRPDLYHADTLARMPNLDSVNNVTTFLDFAKLHNGMSDRFGIVHRSHAEAYFGGLAPLCHSIESPVLQKLCDGHYVNQTHLYNECYLALSYHGFLEQPLRPDNRSGTDATRHVKSTTPISLLKAHLTPGLINRPMIVRDEEHPTCQAQKTADMKCIGNPRECKGNATFSIAVDKNKIDMCFTALVA